MTLLAPYWLFAASAILLPIAIHLWNKRQGKTVKVGSIRWLEASASKQWSQIRLSDMWLLLLRCFILILLAVALANPVLDISPEADKGQKAAYIAPELLYTSGLKEIKSTVDKLLAQDYKLHTFTPTFTPITKELWEQIGNTTPDSIVENGNYWQLLRALAEKHPNPQDSIWLFTSDQQRHFSGSPTTLQENITWVPVAAQQPIDWLQAAYLIKDDSIRVIAGKSTRENTNYKKYTVSAKNTSATIGSLQTRLVQQQDSLSLVWGEKGQHAIAVQQEPIHVQFVADEQHQPEIHYLRAAIQAISNYTGIPILFEKANTTRNADWLFWLSEAQVPDSVLQLTEQGMHLWIQPGAKPIRSEASLITSNSPIRLYQVSEQVIQNPEQIIWAATDGEPLLTAQLQGKGSIYFFRSGFDPKWGMLGQSAQLPELVLPLLLQQPTSIKQDARALPEAMLKPERATILTEKIIEKQAYSLLPWFALLAAVLFLVERFISSTRAKV